MPLTRILLYCAHSPDPDDQELPEWQANAQACADTIRSACRQIPTLKRVDLAVQRIPGIGMGRDRYGRWRHQATPQLWNQEWEEPIWFKIYKRTT